MTSSIKQTEKVAAETGIYSRKVEWFAIRKGFIPRRYPLVHGAIAGWYGEVGVVWPESELLKKNYQGQKEGLEKELGTPPFTAAVAASLMAAKGCQILTGKYRTGQLAMTFFDLLEDDWESVQL